MLPSHCAYSPDCQQLMKQSGNRFIETKALKSHANSLNLRFLDDAELEFYEQHRLFLPSVRRNLPRDYVVATTQQGLGLPVANQEDLNPPEPLRKAKPGSRERPPSV